MVESDCFFAPCEADGASSSPDVGRVQSCGVMDMIFELQWHECVGEEGRLLMLHFAQGVCGTGIGARRVADGVMGAAFCVMRIRGAEHASA